MDKPIASYTINILAEDSGQLGAQIIFNGPGNLFVGRIDFYKTGITPATSYLWHPTSTTDPNQIYLVLCMRMEEFAAVTNLIKVEGPWTIELWPSTNPMVGATTPGYGGKIFTPSNQPIG